MECILISRRPRRWQLKIEAENSRIGKGNASKKMTQMTKLVQIEQKVGIRGIRGLLNSPRKPMDNFAGSNLNEG